MSFVYLCLPMAYHSVWCLKHSEWMDGGMNGETIYIYVALLTK